MSWAWTSGSTFSSSAMSSVLRTPGDDVLALGVDEEVAAGLRRAGDLVAAEGDARPAAVALVAEHHLLHVDGGAPVVGDPVDAPVGLRALAVPGVEDGPDGLLELLARVGGELVELLEGARELLQRLDVELGVVLDAAVGLDALDLVLELLALDAAHDVAEHLHEAPVGVPREALVVGLLGQPLHRLVVEPEVQDGVEHARHRLARARAHRHEQRVVGVAEPLARVLLEPLQRLVDLLLQALGKGVLAHVGHARLGGDREPARHPVGPEDARHLRDVGALASQQLAHVPRALGELVDPFGRHPAGDPIGPPPGASESRRGARACR